MAPGVSAATAPFSRNSGIIMASPLPKTFRIALWATNIAHPLKGIEDWAAMVEAQMAEVAAAGARLLMMPEYAAEQWLSFAPPALTPQDEIPWMAAQSETAFDAIRDLPAKHKVALLAGTMPVPLESSRQEAGNAAPWLNRAWLLLPDGRAIAQDKLCLTPAEKDPESWNLSTGHRLQLVTWEGIRIAVVICLDVELPALAAKLAPARPDLILVPSQTGSLAGYHRVFSCARARAVELQSAVAVCGTVGAAAYGRERAGTTSGCSLFLPCEERLGSHGRAAEIAPVGRHDSYGPLLLADIPLAALDALRGGEAEVWPGAWDAAHVDVVEVK